jgi:predicted transcriptional regulator
MKISLETPCIFATPPEVKDSMSVASSPVNQKISLSLLSLGVYDAGSSIGIGFPSSVPLRINQPEGSTNDDVDFRPWVDTTPITVEPKMEIDTVLDMFKKLGLRYAIVTSRGKLDGIVTKKDMLINTTHRRD